MNSSKIIVKTLDKTINADFTRILMGYPKIHFFNHKINGEYITTIKCHNYYQDILPTFPSNLYGSYIYLYTSISLILSQFIIDQFEDKIISCFWREYKTFFSNRMLEKIQNISSIMLDYNFPSDESKKIFLHRKDIIFNELIHHFRHQNHLNIDAFSLFSLKDYHTFLYKTIIQSFDTFLIDKTNEDFIKFLLNNFFK